MKQEIYIEPEFSQFIEKIAADENKSIEEFIVEVLENNIVPEIILDVDEGIISIVDLIKKISCITDISYSERINQFWWIKFKININSNIAWKVIQEFSHILNYLSLDERLPVKFYPVSPPPYLNGGPENYLSWIIEGSLYNSDSLLVFEYLEGRLPENLDDNNW